LIDLFIITGDEITSYDRSTFSRPIQGSGKILDREIVQGVGRILDR